MKNGFIRTPNLALREARGWRPMRDWVCGFTLVETIIVIALSTILMLIVASLVYTFSTASSYEQAVVGSSGSTSAVMHELEALVPPASAVLASHTFASGTYTSSATALVLQIPAVDASGAVVAGAYDYAVFYTVGATAYRLLETSVSSARTPGLKTLGMNLGAVSFTYDTGDLTQARTVTTDARASGVVRQVTLSDERHESLTLRNHL
jgi:prepilin-type N-terminal cleavage/methylation domain-containing protein